jgi:hypothetical protein
MRRFTHRDQLPAAGVSLQELPPTFGDAGVDVQVDGPDQPRTARYAVVLYRERFFLVKTSSGGGPDAALRY